MRCDQRGLRYEQQHPTREQDRMYSYERGERPASNGCVGAEVSAQIICASKADKDREGHGDRHAAEEDAIIGASSRCWLACRLRGSDCRHSLTSQRRAFYQGAGDCGSWETSDNASNFAAGFWVQAAVIGEES